MSDLLRSLIDNRRRSPMGMGNNPAPFPIQQPQQSMQQMLNDSMMRADTEAMMAPPPGMDDARMGQPQRGQQNLADFYSKNKKPMSDAEMIQKMKDNPFYNATPFL